MEQYVDLAICIGKGGVIHHEAEEEMRAKYENLFIYRCVQNSSFFDDFNSHLSEIELLSFFLGEVFIEELLFPFGNGVGSTTPTKFIYRVIQQRNMDQDRYYGDWAYEYSLNEHVPYDGLIYGKDSSLHKSESLYDQSAFLKNNLNSHPLLHYFIKGLGCTNREIDYLINNWDVVQKQHPNSLIEHVTHFGNLIRWQSSNIIDFPITPNDVADITDRAIIAVSKT